MSSWQSPHSNIAHHEGSGAIRLAIIAGDFFEHAFFWPAHRSWGRERGVTQHLLHDIDRHFISNRLSADLMSERVGIGLARQCTFIEARCIHRFDQPSASGR